MFWSIAMNWYFKTLKKYAVFEGRAQRLEYWLFMLFSSIISASLKYVDITIGSFDIGAGFGPFSALYTLLIIIPGVAVSVRRLHDIGKSGWWFLITAVPILGLIVFLFFMVRDSQPEANKYGYPAKSK
jgi:uncharacterized membrane protein YhaH (DUF805 family)